VRPRVHACSGGAPSRPTPLIARRQSRFPWVRDHGPT
jgi:hypothetical protein